ncbi:AAA ATPase midasin, partial [Chytridiales sp. JEL 0842]
QLSSILQRLSDPLKQFLNGPLEDTTYKLEQFQLTRSLYRLLRFKPNFFKSLWDWSPIYNALLSNEVPEAIVAYSLQIIAIIASLSASGKETFFDNVMAQYESRIDPSFVRLTEDEIDAIAKIRSLETSRRLNTYLSLSKDPLFIRACQLSPSTVEIAGRLIPMSSANSQMTNVPFNSDTLVPTATTLRNIQKVVDNFLRGSPILLLGVNGSGKSAVVEECARLTGRQNLVRIHAGDQTDSKSLLGAYICDSEPGKFCWQYGILTTAIKLGYWLLIEDIDRASPETMATLGPLLESRQVFIPSRGETITAHESFRIFATSSASHLDKTKFPLWNAVEVDPLPMEEVKIIVETLFSSLIPFWDKIRASYENTCEFLGAYPSIGRKLTLRDMLKWCSRVHKFFTSPHYSADVNSLQPRELLYNVARICFTSFISEQEIRHAACDILAASLDIPTVRAEFYREHYIPTESIEAPNMLCIGHISLFTNTLALYSKTQADTGVFAMTRSSLLTLEQIASGVSASEPVLLVGESGTGKTTLVQYLAKRTHNKISVMNLSQQTDASDLLGGFKPVEPLTIFRPVMDQFQTLFTKTFSTESNLGFLQTVSLAFSKKKYGTVLKGFENAIGLAKKVLSASAKPATEKNVEDTNKRAKRSEKDTGLRAEWDEFAELVASIKAQLSHLKMNVLFSFVEGLLVQAIKAGDWILLDEVNLATSEVLESLCSLLQSPTESIILLERGDTKPIKRHPNFRLFACMNPATDVGKRDLPVGLRSRFTELWVDPPDAARSDLISIVQRYLESHLPPASQGGENIVQGIAEFHLSARKASEMGQLVDCAGHRCYINIRMLTRALSFAADFSASFGLQQSLYEGIQMAYVTMHGKESADILDPLIQKHVLDSFPKKLTKLIKPSASSQATRDGHILVGSYWLKVGSFPENVSSTYILTAGVEKNLLALVRGVACKKYPILIQGPTSAGKTSMIEYLAKRSGHKFIRVNNHEHTDLQEYLGSYVPDDTGRLVFKEGVLVNALRNGYWIVLDELNLAPSDVLEALNRLLDDNRELLIPETQEVVRPHKDFMLFATQNPPGLYGGRKQLSRAFRSRFLELSFEDINEVELETILQRRCQIAPRYASKIVSIFKALRTERQRSNIFQGKNAFATLRDLFRWANRDASTWLELAEDGYMLLAERARRAEEKNLVQSVIERELKVKVDPVGLYNRLWKHYMDVAMNEAATYPGLVWTNAMKRLFVLVMRSVQFKEAVLLVGETGCGKTTVCQQLSEYLNIKLHIVNAHAGSETSDFLGSMRPFRGRQKIQNEVVQSLRQFCQKFDFVERLVKFDNLQTGAFDVDPLISELSAIMKTLNVDQARDTELEDIARLNNKSKCLFEWKDGPLVEALKAGDAFLLDEISLADDSVLERLNSVLESDRILVLTEGTSSDIQGTEQALVVQAAESFTFLATMNPGGDFGKKELSPALRNRFTEIWVNPVSDTQDLVDIISQRLLEVEEKLKFEKVDASLLATKMLQFIEFAAIRLQKPFEAVFSLRDILSWVNFICCCLKSETQLTAHEALYHGGLMVFVDGIGINPLLGLTGSASQSLHTELLQKLRELCNVHIGSNNSLSSVAPVLNEAAGSFGIYPFMLKTKSKLKPVSDYALLAPTTCQNVLRVLRGMQLRKPILLEGSPGVGKTSLVTALAKTCGYNLCRINFSEQTDLMDLFGSDLPAENGKPGDFSWVDGPFLRAMKTGDWVLLDELNLASQQVLEVYVESLTRDDLLLIISNLHPEVPKNIAEKMIVFNDQMHTQTMVIGTLGKKGRPWEFNLRDVLRWLELFKQSGQFENLWEYVQLLYSSRMRTNEDRHSISKLFSSIFVDNQPPKPQPKRIPLVITPDLLQVGSAKVPRQDCISGRQLHLDVYSSLHILNYQLEALEALTKCVEMSWGALLTGSCGVGKTAIVRLLSLICGQQLQEVSLNSDVDTGELLGGFEQVDMARKKECLKSEALRCIESCTRLLLQHKTAVAIDIAQKLQSYLHAINSDQTNATSTLKFSLAATSKAMSGLEADWITCLQRAGVQGPTDILHAIEQLETSTMEGRFEWVDGVLLRAVKEGKWILLDNANTCPSSVLDRLNSLMERGGVLLINERGLINGDVEVVRPHKNFRIFLTMDPQNGEISRAMRNRLIEISLLAPSKCSLTNGQFGSDIGKILNMAGNFDPTVCENIEKAWLSSTDETNRWELLQLATSMGSLETYKAHESFLNPNVKHPHTLACIPFNVFMKESVAMTNQMVLSSSPTYKAQVWPQNTASSFAWEEPLLASTCRDGALILELLMRDSTDVDVQYQNQSISTKPSSEILCYFALEEFLCITDFKVGQNMKHCLKLKQETGMFLVNNYLSNSGELRSMPLQVASELGSKASNFGVMVLGDSIALTIESEMICDIFLWFYTHHQSQVPDFLEVETVSTCLTLRQLISRIRSLVDFTLRHSSLAPANIEPWQRMLWILENYTDKRLADNIGLILNEIACRWHQNLWNRSSSWWVGFRKSSHLLHGSFGGLENYDAESIVESPLHSEIFSFDIVVNLLGKPYDIPLYAWENKRKQLEDVNTLLRISLDHNVRIETAEVVEATLMILSIIKAAQTLLPPVAQADLGVQMSRLANLVYFGIKRGSLVDKAREACATVSAIHRILLAAAARSRCSLFLRHSTTCLDFYIQACSDGFSQKSKGKLWVFGSLSFFKSCLSIGHILDPVSTSISMIEYLQTWETLELSRLTLLSRNGFNVSGVTTANILTSLSNLREKRLHHQRRVTYRPTSTQLRDIYHELQYLTSTILSDESLLDFLNDIKAPETLILKEQAIQSTLTAFVERLESKYPFYGDLLHPVCLHVFRVKLGIKSLTENRISKANYQNGIIMPLVQYFERIPHELDTVQYLTSADECLGPVYPNGSWMESKTRRDICLYLLKRLATWRIGIPSDKSMNELNKLFEELTNMWFSADEYRRQQELQKAQKFIARMTNGEPESMDTDEEDIHDVFPDYQEALEFSEAPNVSQHNQKVEGKDIEHFTNEFAWQVLSIHQQLFGRPAAEKLDSDRKQGWTE